MPKTEAQQTTSTAGLIGLAAFGGAIAGFFLQLLVAYYFGASVDTDAFFMAQSTSELLSKLLLGGSITAVFLPLFVGRLAQGKREEAWRLGLNLLHLTGGAMLVLVVVLGFFAEPFVRFVAPGFDAPTQALTVQLLRVLLPSFVLLFLVDLLVAMLHSLKAFAVPALLRLVAPLTSIVVLLLLVNTVGIYALAVGTVVGAGLQLGAVMTTLYRQGFRYRFVFQPHDPTIRRLLYLVYPFVLSVMMTQGAGIVHRILVSELAIGSLSALKFAEKITQLLTIMFLNSVTIVTFPLMSEKAARGDMAGLQETIAAAVRLIVFVMVPLTAGVVLLREPLIALLFERGSFSTDDTTLTAVALLFLALGLTINGISSVFGHATLALQQTRAAVAVTVVTQFLATGLFVLLAPRFGVAGLAAAAALVPIGIALLYFLYLLRFMPRLLDIFRHRVFGQTLVLVSGLIVVVWLIQEMPLPAMWPGTLVQLIQVVTATVAGMVVYFGGAYAWGVVEMMDVAALIQGKLKKWRR